jgi:Zn-dependent M28 family amino/carboxypeptidase
MAHLDSYADNQQDTAPGADDNGSGIAVLMELSRILATRPNEKTIILAFFSNEENSSQGSKAFVRKAVDNGFEIEAAINIDVLGYNNKAFSLAEAVGAHSTSKHKLKACYRIFANRVNSALKGNNLIKVAGQKPTPALAKKLRRI